MALITGEKTEAEADRYNARQSNFYSQSVAQNNARLDSKSTAEDMWNEIKFIEAQLLEIGMP